MHEVEAWSFKAWMELPFYVAVEYESTFEAKLGVNQSPEMSLRIRNDLNKIVTGNQWEQGKAIEEWRAQTESDDLYFKAEPGPKYEIETHYVPEDQVAKKVDELRARDEIPYTHVEELQSVAELSAPLPESAIPPNIEKKGGLGAVPMVPTPGWYGREVLPRLNRLISAYRIATLPELRYSVHPVSEGLFNYALETIRNPDGEPVVWIGRRIDPHDVRDRYDHHVDRLAVENRLEAVLSDYDDLTAEDSFASVYFLFHLRRWTEALVIASAVVDDLLEEAVYTHAEDEELADVLWSGHGHRYRDVFKEVLPLLGLPKLANADGGLWRDLRDAKQFRGKLAHGATLDTFDRGDQRDVQSHLTTFYRVARWLATEMGRGWALDIREDGELKDVFP